MKEAAEPVAGVGSVDVCPGLGWTPSLNQTNHLLAGAAETDTCQVSTHIQQFSTENTSINLYLDDIETCK